MSADKPQGIRDMEPPKRVKDLRKLLGVFGYNERFAPRYFECTACLIDLLKKERNFEIQYVPGAQNAGVDWVFRYNFPDSVGLEGRQGLSSPHIGSARKHVQTLQTASDPRRMPLGLGNG
ncbi:hypothetical protein QBC47DRAFT_366171 [Echria macrotheca]|uniref:Uncharacterized protein n=1 Tax=Echria macrotheca TaxID=438768 RepID=A0AAJ0B317_9PEZI|nr:hypothetical protein QBC47DRAFT_366171 [Echria macrotheca]